MVRFIKILDIDWAIKSKSNKESTDIAQICIKYFL